MAQKRGKTYRTASGKSVDFGAMLLANETAPALGNMNVNARGDQIAPDGTITKTREEIMREYNDLNTMIPTDDAIPEGTGIVPDDDDWKDWEPPVKTETQQPETVAVTEEPSKEVAQPDPEPAVETKTPTGGLAAAVAAAKTVENKVQQPAHVQEKEKEGVRRI